MDKHVILNSRFFEMADDSMEPTIEQGDTIMVDTLAEINDSDIILVQLINGTFMCRRAYQTDDGYLLKADNSAQTISDEQILHVIGKVVKKYKPT